MNDNNCQKCGKKCVPTKLYSIETADKLRMEVCLSCLNKIKAKDKRIKMTGEFHG